MGITLYLDDERELPDYFPKNTIVCRGYHQAIKAVEDANYEVDLISFDHDLGTGCYTGYDFACRVEEWVYNGLIKNKFKMHVHSQNPVGANRIKQVCQQMTKFFMNKNNELSDS